MEQTSTRTTLIYGVIALVVIIGVLVFADRASGGPGQYDGFAQCLKDKGATFYGAFWCPHCQNQKAMFGKSKDLLPYVECSTPDQRGQTQVCIDKGIKTYPTWYFPDMSSTTGETSLQTLSERTNCPLPTSTSAATSTEK